ncbi:phosphoglycerate mutase family protein, partial [Opisthorchis viverrini]
CAQTTTIPPKVTPWDWNWDGRHPQSSVVQATGDNSDGQLKRNTCSRHLIFIRHGQYHYAESDEECRLTQLGREQLDLTGLRLKHLKFPYSIVHYSTMTRAVESTEEVLKHLPGVKAIPSDLLREGAPYPLEPPLPYYRPTAEELKRDGDRIETAFKSFVHRPDCGQTRDTYEIFICHANSFAVGNKRKSLPAAGIGTSKSTPVVSILSLTSLRRLPFAGALLVSGTKTHSA